MKKQVNLPIPSIRALKKLGQDISCARRRRRITVQLISERANLSKNTILKIEQGSPSVSMGGYAAVLFVLGLTERIGNLADSIYDLTGRQLEDENLPKRIHLPKNRDQNESQ
jgi:transcriptional regulator with XRE-family HTH domain